jgi:mono/diheme cytochrome c family protein
MLRRPTVLAVAVLVCLGSAGAQPTVSAFDSLKARALLSDILPCLGCHTLHGEGGHIGPDLGTVRQRRSPSYIAAMIDTPQQAVPGSAMLRTPLDASMRALLIRYLAGVAEAPAPMSVATVAPAKAGAPNGGALYARWCASCHGPTGAGDGPNARFLPVRPAVHRDGATMQNRSDDQLFDAIAAGGAAMGRSPRMPAFGASLTSGEIRALVAHLRALCQCRQPAWATR